MAIQFLLNSLGIHALVLQKIFKTIVYLTTPVINAKKTIDVARDRNDTYAAVYEAAGFLHLPTISYR